VKVLLVCLIFFSQGYSFDNLSYKIDKSLKTTHKYAGYAILSLLGANVYLGLSNESSNFKNDMQLHKDIGSALYAITITSTLVGIYSHRDELFDFSEGVTKEHIHALLGLTALSLMAYNQEYLFDTHKDTGLWASGISFVAYSVTLF